MKWPRILGVMLLASLAAGWTAFQLWPVQIMVLGYRLTHRVAPNQPVRWAEGPATPSTGARPPNIVLILADDLGINDITAEGPGRGVAGGLVPTPNIDSIAREGADFTVAYAANATCSPSRAALMTGRYPPRFGFEFTAVPDQLAKYVPRYSPRNRPHPTIYHAELQREAPAMADMGMPASEVTIAEVLKSRGYHTIHLGKWHLGEAKGMRPEDQGFDESLGFMPGASKYEPDTASVDAKLPGDPLDRFLWLALSDAVQLNGGRPFHASTYMTDYLSDEAGAAIRANRNRPFFIYLAYNAPHTPFQATRADYDALGAIRDPRLRVYGAMIRALDRGVGKVMAALKAAGVDENTIVIFTNDNGGAWYAGLKDINKPYRGWKGTFFEGGIRTPFFVKWPARIAPGQRLSMPVQLIDVLPTLAAAAGAPLPRGRVIDGMNLLPFMTEHAPEVSRTFFWRSGTYEAIRDADWKLQVSRNPPRIWLFDLASDPTERVDLSADRPDVVARLRAELDAHDSQMAKPLWPALLEEPIRIDVPADAPWKAGQEYVYWPN
ncbi:MAG TPA: sulfatase-like hydrolase/transferase [Sphingomicrobium sp.]|jgi:arylsulfatase A-like enzyme|nr:sulfatase-like hydrolase/transferase [Sphingomicrobium sp.]